MKSILKTGISLLISALFVFIAVFTLIAPISPTMTIPPSHLDPARILAAFGCAAGGLMSMLLESWESDLTKTMNAVVFAFGIVLAILAALTIIA